MRKDPQRKERLEIKERLERKERLEITAAR
jgi:hypothetical protein